ncbi:MFS transporter [Erwinia aphidicola]
MLGICRVYAGFDRLRVSQQHDSAYRAPGDPGAGAALLVPTSLTLIRLTFQDANTRRTAVAMWGACGGIALAAGPVLGGILIQYFGWRSVFLINIPIGLIAIILILRFAPASPRVEKKVDAAGQIMSAMAIASLTYAVTESSERGWTALPVSALCLAAIFTLSFIVTERHVADPMLPPRLVKKDADCHVPEWGGDQSGFLRHRFRTESLFSDSQRL